MAFISNQSFATCIGPITASPWWNNKPLATALATQLGGGLGTPLLGQYGPMFAYQTNSTTVGNSAWNGSSVSTSDTGWPSGGVGTALGTWAVDPAGMDANCPATALGGDSTPAAIPTLSEWAMIFLASLMGLFSFVRMRR